MASLSDDCHGFKDITVAIPEDIMMLIVRKLDVEDLHCFGAVCKSWQSIAVAEKKIRHLCLRPQLPWLMLSSLEDHQTGFVSLSNGKELWLELPEAYGARCFGSNWGWLIMVGKMGRNFLLNPFTRVVIDLPTQATLPVQYDPNPEGLPLNSLCAPEFSLINKAMLLSPVATNDCVVIAIYCNCHLAFCKPGDESWTALGIDFEDIIFYAGKLYGISEECDLKLVELVPHPKVSSCNIAPPSDEDLRLPFDKLFKSFYLVESLGELMLVIDCCFRYDSSFFVESVLKIFKLDLKSRSWITVDNLGDQMLFIGKSTASSVSACDYPGFRGNCIYNTISEDERFVDSEVEEIISGLVHFKDNSFEPFISKNSGSSLSPAIWFIPIS